MGGTEFKHIKVLGISLNKSSFSFISVSPQLLRYWLWGPWAVRQVADAPRDSCLEIRALGYGPGPPCTGWVMCHIGFCSCKQPKLIPADVIKVELTAKTLEGHRVGRRLRKSENRWKPRCWAEGAQEVGTPGTVLEHKRCGQVCLVVMD